jgi:ribosomal protein L19E
MTAMEAEEWGRKGATLSGKTARSEYGLTQDEINAAIDAGKLRYRPAAMHSQSSARERTSADAEGERTRSADLPGGPGHGRRVGQAEFRDPLEPDLEGDPEFHAGQV